MDDTPRRRPQRPLLEGDQTAQVTVRIPSRLFDAAYKLASRNNETMPAVLRRGLVHVLRAESADDE